MVGELLPARRSGSLPLLAVLTQRLCVLIFFFGEREQSSAPLGFGKVYLESYVSNNLSQTLAINQRLFSVPGLPSMMTASSLGCLFFPLLQRQRPAPIGVGVGVGVGVQGP